MRQVFTNEDGSTGVRYLVTCDLTLNADPIITIYQRQWKVEEYHRSLKQNAALTKSPTRTGTTQTNHFVAALWSFVKIELLKVRTRKNHYQLKRQLYLSALQQAFSSCGSLSRLHWLIPLLRYICYLVKHQFPVRMIQVHVLAVSQLKHNASQLRISHFRA